MRGKCGTLEGDFTALGTVRTDELNADEFVCGPGTEINIENQSPKMQLQPGEVITAQGFEILLTSVKGGDGMYSGTGHATIPMFNHAKVRVEFNNIFINTDNQMVRGTIRTVYNPDSPLMVDGDAIEEDLKKKEDSENTDDTKEDKEQEETPDNEIEIDGEIEDITINEDGQIVIVDTEGNETVKEQPTDEDTGEKEDVVVKDGEGNEYVVDRDGKVSEDGSNEGGIEDVVTENTETARDKYLKFVIDGKEYMDGDNYYTMYTKKELEIKVEQTDTVTRDLSGITWELEGDKITPDKDDPTVLRLMVKKSNLPKSNNVLMVSDRSGNKISKLKIKTYRGPEIVFDEKATYNGEYLFDHGYEFNPIVGDYESFTIGPNNDTYYAPVLGILKGGHATIRLNVKQLKPEASKDPDFSVVIKPELSGKILIDGLDSLVLNANTLGSTKTIIIQASDFIDANYVKYLKSMKIMAYLPSTGEQVGMMEYFCSEREQKEVKLIYVKFTDEQNYPSYISAGNLEPFLDNQSMNQLFLDFSLSTDTLQSQHTTTDVQKWTKRQILDSLNKEFFKGAVPLSYNHEKDYYYVTNLEIKTSSGSNVGAFHYTGGNGGVQMKHQKTVHGETAEEATTHELGHWLGLPHTWGSNSHISVIINSTQGGTRDNFMDYKIRRKKWVKRHLLNYDR